MREDLLRSVLAQESRAYGFTLAFWGSGALLIGSYGLPSLAEILLYTVGALIGFGFMTVLAFKDAFTTVETKEPEYLVFSMVHYMAALLPILVAHLLTQLKYASFLPFMGLDSAFFAFLLSGIGISTVYNLSIPVEDRLSRKALKLEKRLMGL